MNKLEKLIAYVSPSTALKRELHRQKLDILASNERAFEGAATGRRHTSWKTNTITDPNEEIAKDLPTLTARARDLHFNNPYAKRAPRTIANNVVGTGILPTPRIVAKLGKLSSKPNNRDTATIASLKAAWHEWAANVKCDFDEKKNLYALQHMAMRSIIINGEVIVLRKKMPVEYNKFGIQIQLLEGDFLDSSKTTETDPDGGYTQSGVKFNSIGKITGYYLFDKHPARSGAKSSLVPSTDVLHVFDAERIGQIRGIPAAAASMVKQRDLDDYEDAELVGKKTAACMPIFVSKNDLEEVDDSSQEVVEEISPGMITYLRNGESMSYATPPQNNSYEGFTRAQYRGIANGYCIPYETFTNDYSQVNFSSGRMGAIEFQKNIEHWQYLFFIPSFCECVYSWWLEHARISLGIKADINIAVEWTAPVRQMIDPLKETTADKIAVRAGFNSPQNIMRQNGYDPELILSDLKEMNQLYADAGLMPECDPSFELKAKINMNTKTSEAKEIPE
ncbi:lambda family phage portal protein [Chitinophaga skermanii]|uniref:Lambda family phage portal protein n=1 Tax=Chitinophaga skermanii TaxID=331697 RepID=A0A327Q828_9BACT|nr:phage portal protein [Chitinophaga skermanii]RAJ00461.1 lambda family phage portal protein [Chitinophaga skermanii]